MKKFIQLCLLSCMLVVGSVSARDTIVPYQPRLTPDHERWSDPGPAKSPGEWMHPGQRDNDRDGIPNYLDKDDDNDGIPDNVDKDQYRKSAL